MPLVQMQMSCQLSDAQKDALSADLCREVHGLTGKPEDYIMVSIQHAHVVLGGCEDPAAWVDYRSIGGVDPDVNAELTRVIGEVVARHTGVDPARLYVVITDVPATFWGWNHKTFGG